MSDRGMGASRILDLREECGRFCRYLLGVVPTPGMVEAYCAAHRDPRLDPQRQADRFLLRVAGAGRWAARMADAYSRAFARDATLRAKLVLCLAILETCPPSHRLVNRGHTPGWRAVTAAALAGSGWLLSLVLGMVVLGPVHLALRLGASDG